MELRPNVKEEDICNIVWIQEADSQETVQQSQADCQESKEVVEKFTQASNAVEIIV